MTSMRPRNAYCGLFVSFSVSSARRLGEHLNLQEETSNSLQGPICKAHTRINPHPNDGQ